MKANIRFLDGSQITEVVEKNQDNLYTVKWKDASANKSFRIETGSARIDLVLGGFYRNEINELSTINNFSDKYVFGHLISLTD